MAELGCVAEESASKTPEPCSAASVASQWRGTGREISGRWSDVVSSGNKSIFSWSENASITVTEQKPT